MSSFGADFNIFGGIPPNMFRWSQSIPRVDADLKQYRGAMLQSDPMQCSLRVCLSTWDEFGETVSTLEAILFLPVPRRKFSKHVVEATGQLSCKKNHTELSRSVDVV